MLTKEYGLLNTNYPEKTRYNLQISSLTYLVKGQMLDNHFKQAQYRAPMKFNYMTKQVFNWHRICLRGYGYSRLCVRGIVMI